MNRLNLFLAIFCLATAGAFGYSQYELKQIKEEVVSRDSQTVMALDKLASSSTETSVSLQALYNTLGRIISDEEKKNSVIQEQLGNVSKTVGALDKLAKSDPQLLKKYSKVYFLNEHYAPTHVIDIPATYSVNDGTVYQIHAQVSPFLEKMLADARSQGLDLLITSAYRSFATQARIKTVNETKFGTTKANTFSADQGYSEHQLGTTLDFATSKTGASFAKFGDTAEYAWLTNNAYRYGFILSYPKGNSYYVYEPWHWRFVGIDLATRLHNEGRNFYDVDQKTIDGYLVDMFEVR